MNKQQSKQLSRARRAKRIRKTIIGSAARLRLSVSKTNTGMFLQLINDEKGVTVASVHTREISGKQPKVDSARAAGKMLAEKAKAKNVTAVVFDRGGNRYTGRVKAAADGAREGGLEF